MKTIFTSLFILMLTATYLGQEVKAGPHNGQLKKAGYYYVEVVSCARFLEVYVYDMRMYPLRNVGMTGTVDFHYSDSTCYTTELDRYGVEGFTAQPLSDAYTGCDVFISGRAISIRASFRELICRPSEE